MRDEKIYHVNEQSDQVFAGSSGSSTFFEKVEAGDYYDDDDRGSSGSEIEHVKSVKQSYIMELENSYMDDTQIGASSPESISVEDEDNEDEENPFKR